MRALTLAGQSFVIVTIAFILLGAASNRAEACSCLQPTVESSYNNSSDVFIASVSRQLTFGNTRYYFARVQRTFKGCLAPRARVVLTTPVDSAACGVELSTTQYLINGTAAGTRFGVPAFSIGLCSYNLPAADLTAHDNAFLNGRTVCCGDSCTCADGSLPVQCFVDPCQVAPACAEGSCTANYCGGCNAEFYDSFGNAVCQAESECEADADCPQGQWCRQAAGNAQPPIYECVPFVGEGQRCDGFTTPSNYEQCAAGLVCDTPDFLIDAPGICRRSCAADADCASGEYCASDHLCDRAGACERDVDCNLPGNAYPHIECVGFGVCGDDQQCGWQCGDPQCVDLAGFDFGPCDAVLGWAVQDGACAQVSGCGSEQFALFKTEEACQSTCQPDCKADSACRRTGCSGQVCAAMDVITTCEFRPEYECYQDPEIARCGCNAGRCGWTPNDKLDACLESGGPQ